MSKTVRPILETLFASQGRSAQPVDFEWRLICRKGRPFLLLPLAAASARTGLELYSPQRRRAKIWRALLPLLLSTPAAKIFERIRLRVDIASEFMQFMARQTGIPAGELCPGIIKLSEVGKCSRLVLLLCDECGRPTRVIKAGINAAGQTAINREADFLEQLPTNTLGCIRMTGRLLLPAFSVFATDYFPGESPQDDTGMEHLFHAWLNLDPPVPIESLPMWRELTATGSEHWPTLNRALAGKTVRTTLYHGDFAPWNIRVVNSQNLQAFDWERGQLRGIPGWDWFHFIVQTAILAKRHTAARAAAEVEQLIHSPRFKKYAEAAGISELVQPLVLAYLLHHAQVIQPLEGGRITAELFEFLHAHWELKSEPLPHVASPEKPVALPSPGLLATCRFQLQSVADQWNNLFWEPSLNSAVPPSWSAQFQAKWPIILLANVALGIVVTVQFFSASRMLFLPFYLAICALMTWKVGRRWGSQAAVVAAVAGPWVAGFKDAAYWQWDVIIWNTLMRFIVMQMCVLFVDRIHKQKDFFRRQLKANGRPAKWAETWAVVLACLLVFCVVVMTDIATGPHMTVLPLYLFPCMVLTLALNFRWGIVAALIANFADTYIGYTTSLNAVSVAQVFGWDFVMRLAVFLLVIALLNRIRKENILFFSRKSKAA